VLHDMNIVMKENHVCMRAIVRVMPKANAARGITAHVYDQVDNEMVERWSSATKASRGERRREIN
jgi:uncharacterized protein YutE (UPF0331/DUF86 family)